jgi:hypothetical protein
MSGLAAIHAPVGTRSTNSTWSCWFIDGVATTIKGIANNFFPIHPTDSYLTQMGKMGVKLATIPLTVGALYFFPKISLITALSLLSLGLLAKTFSHQF